MIAQIATRRLWFVVGWTMVGAVIWLSLTPAPPKVGFEASGKLGHLLGCAVLMFWFAQLYARRTRVLYAAGFIAMGIALEVVQGELGYRTYDVFDMYANSLGVLAGWAAALAFPRVLPRL